MKPWILLFLAGLLILSTQLATAKSIKQFCPPKVKPGECPKDHSEPQDPMEEPSRKQPFPVTSLGSSHPAWPEKVFFLHGTFLFGLPDS
ncbi:hypothetical protein E2320_009411 [Naja naja]|nr:hypothetical protein E2320_009411 [Naja naja]